MVRAMLAVRAVRAVRDGVERGIRARPQGNLGRVWHTKRAGGFTYQAHVRYM